MAITKLGSVELAGDILEKCNVGLWAFELDAGQLPRMYVNDTMMKLLGLTHKLSPEETYHAWYDFIDKKHYREVAEAVEQMTAGNHAEVQYPWHHPNGDTWIVRCGGVRNFEYTKGVRIEGTHQNVTKLAHYEARTLADLLSTLSEDFLDVYFLDPYTGSFSAFSNKSSFDGDDPRDFSKVNFYEDVADKSGGIVHPDDKPLIDEKYNKQHLISILENDEVDEFVVRWPNKHDGSFRYMKNKIMAYDDFDETKKLIIGVQDVSKQMELERVQEEQLIIMEALGKDYDYIDVIELQEDKSKDSSRHFRSPDQEGTLIPTWESDLPYSLKLDAMRDEIVFEPDREAFYHQTRREMILRNLQRDKVYYVNFRIVLYDIIHYAQIKYIGITNGSGKIIRLFAAYINADKQMTQQMEIRRRLTSALHDAETVGKKNWELLNNLSGDIQTAMRDILETDGSAISHLHDTEIVKDCLLKNDLICRQTLGLVSEILNAERDARFNKNPSELNLAVLRGKRIIMAEDNAMNLEIATEILQSYGITVIPAENGQIALDLVKAAFIEKTIEPVDLILMDGQMPVMDGYAATMAIRSLSCEIARKIPIVAMTANSFNEDKQRSYGAGMDAHLSKPIDSKAMEKILVTLLQ